jgi:RNA polymerase sigma factor FliA
MDKKSRDILIMKYAPLVKTIVMRMAAKLPIDATDKEDLINVGIIGLMSALDKYDDKKNVQFETYAHFRIRGAVLDELRKRDWVPRSTRNKDSRLEETFAILQRQLGRAPQEEEIADHLGLSIEEYYSYLNEVKSVSVISKEDLPPDYLERYEGSPEMQAAVERGNPLQYLTSQELINGLKKAVAALPEKEKIVLSLYYYEELTMKEIGKVLELTESRVCQIHTQATLRLRALVKDYH